MDVVVALEKRFSVTPDGTVWSQGWLAADFWERYLDVFDNVKVFARKVNVDRPPDRGRIASRDRVSFLDVPFYLGPWQYARKIHQLRAAATAAVESGDAIMLRAPGGVSSLLFAAARRHKHPYGVEVVGDPYDVYDKGSIKSLLRPGLRVWVTRELKEMCRQAATASYVTARGIQQRYPPGPGTYATAYSSIDLGDEAFVDQARGEPTDRNRILFVGTLAQMYKAPDILLKAFAMLRRDVDATLTYVGDGRFRSMLEQMARELGVAEYVTFAGVLPAGDAVRAAFDDCDLFVLPSHGEGLPRVMIEAMARAVPCIGTTISGILELLPEDVCVPPGDAEALAGKMRSLLADKNLMRRLSARNLEEAGKYHLQSLRPRRQAMYRALVDATNQAGTRSQVEI